jgi:hypothetical protein
LLVREIEQLQNNLTALAARENKIYFDASNIELSGELVPDSVTEQLQLLQDARVELTDILAQRRDEHKALEHRYRGYIARFRALKKDSN